MKKPDDKINKEEYITLKEKYDALENKYSKIQDRVASLEKNFFDLMRNEIHNIQRDANEKENEDSTVADKPQVEVKRNQMSDVTIVSDDEDMEDDEEGR